MFNLLSWMIGPIEKSDPVFFEALNTGNADVYQDEAYLPQLQFVTHDMLFDLMKRDLYDAFNWTLSQKSFDLKATLELEGEPQALSLLDFAIKYQHPAYCASLIKQDVSIVLEVPSSLLTSIEKMPWEAFYQAADKNIGSDTKALQYLNTKRRLTLDESALEKPFLGTGHDYRSANLARLRIKAAQLEAELEGWDSVSQQEVTQLNQAFS